ncbi:hypothetical protein TNIN_138641 [Trichonephila inaurata madagascariensis]|uniref:Uncharacterized protein n=1 Tax=Trichonephila inaurata madagascariensis TaxID=2747483 RepID=A0A8X6XEB8_9ARAC|nr:hypothetical protein TNIN_138641 [Trichonephila inaurata madagascariensis]
MITVVALFHVFLISFTFDEIESPVPQNFIVKRQISQELQEKTAKDFFHSTNKMQKGNGSKNSKQIIFKRTTDLMSEPFSHKSQNKKASQRSSFYFRSSNRDRRYNGILDQSIKQDSMPVHITLSKYSQNKRNVSSEIQPEPTVPIRDTILIHSTFPIHSQIVRNVSNLSQLEPVIQSHGISRKNKFPIKNLNLARNIYPQVLKQNITRMILTARRNLTEKLIYINTTESTYKQRILHERNITKGAGTRIPLFNNAGIAGKSSSTASVLIERLPSSHLPEEILNISSKIPEKSIKATTGYSSIGTKFLNLRNKTRLYPVAFNKPFQPLEEQQKSNHSINISLNAQNISSKIPEKFTKATTEDSSTGTRFSNLTNKTQLHPVAFNKPFQHLNQQQKSNHSTDISLNAQNISSKIPEKFTKATTEDSYIGTTSPNLTNKTQLHPAAFNKPFQRLNEQQKSNHSIDASLNVQNISSKIPEKSTEATTKNSFFGTKFLNLTNEIRVQPVVLNNLFQHLSEQQKSNHSKVHPIQQTNGSQTNNSNHSFPDGFSLPTDKLNGLGDSIQVFLVADFSLNTEPSKLRKNLMIVDWKDKLSDKPEKLRKIGLVIMGLAGIILFAMIITCTSFMVSKRKRKRKNVKTPDKKANSLVGVNDTVGTIVLVVRHFLGNQRMNKKRRLNKKSQRRYKDLYRHDLNYELYQTKNNLLDKTELHYKKPKDIHSKILFEFKEAKTKDPEFRKEVIHYSQQRTVERSVQKSESKNTICENQNVEVSVQKTTRIIRRRKKKRKKIDSNNLIKDNDEHLKSNSDFKPVQANKIATEISMVDTPASLKDQAQSTSQEDHAQFVSQEDHKRSASQEDHVQSEISEQNNKNLPSLPSLPTISDSSCFSDFDNRISDENLD